MTPTPQKVHNNRVLVIDDTPNIHEDFKKILAVDEPDGLDALEASLFGAKTASVAAGERFVVDSAFQGMEGCALVKQRLETGAPYAVAFVDMRMPPGWDGLQTIEACWKVDPDLQVVICTAHSDHSWEEITNRVGSTDRLLILKKPFDNIEVRQLASAMVRKWSLGAELRNQLGNLEASVAARTADLMKARAHLEQVVQSAPSFIIAVDHEGRIVEWNRSAERVFGIVASAALGRPFSGCGISWDWSLIDEHLARAGEPAPITLDSVRFRRSATDEGVATVTITSFQTQAGRTTLLVGDDVTERVGMARQLAQAQKLEAIGQLAAGIAHEINTPMQFIGDNVRFLQTAFNDLMKLGDTVRETTELLTSEATARLREACEGADLDFLAKEAPTAIEQTLEGIERVSQIVLAMKKFSHPGVDDRVMVDVNDALKSTLIVARNEWKYLAEVRTDFAEDLPLVECRAGEVNQVFLNVIVNACHAIAEAKTRDAARAGLITVSTRRHAAVVEIRIGDTGCGIPEAVRTRVFDPFFATKEVGKGTGQGLAIAHAVIVKNHGGTISFETEVGKGTTFLIRLPIGDDGDPASPRQG